MSDGADPTDDLGYSESDYHIWHDRFIRYMCIQRREKNQIVFTLYELSLQAEIGGFKPDEKVSKELVLDGKRIYDVVAGRVVKGLLQERLIQPTGDTNMYQMAKKLIKICDSNHRGTFGLPVIELF